MDQKEGKISLCVVIYGHCSFKINGLLALVTGGDQDQHPSASTWFVDLTWPTWTRFTPGPQMKTERSTHGCSTFHLGRKTFGIVAGGYDSGALDSTEIIDLDQESPTWTEGMQDKSKIVSSYLKLKSSFS